MARLLLVRSHPGWRGRRVGDGRPSAPRHQRRTAGKLCVGVKKRGNDRAVASGYVVVEQPTASSAAGVTVYWRPGCPYCSGLRRRLRKLGVRTSEVNIWEYPDAAATVRRLTGGNETVPTVTVAGQVLVNPTGPAVLEMARKLAPDAIDPVAARAQPRSGWPPASIAGWIVVVAAVTASLTVDGTGHGAISWALDALAVAAYLAMRVARHRSAQSERLSDPARDQGR